MRESATHRRRLCKSAQLTTTLHITQSSAIIHSSPSFLRFASLALADFRRYDMYGLHKRANTKQRKSMLKRINTLIKANTLESIFNKVLKKNLEKIYNLFRNLNVHIARVCFQGSTFLSCCWHYQIFRYFKCTRRLLCSFSHVVVIIVLCFLLGEEVKAARQHVVLVIILFLHTKCDFKWKTWKEIWINITQICVCCVDAHQSFCRC